MAGGWFVQREKYCYLMADKPSEQGASESARLPAGSFFFLFIERCTNKTSLLRFPSQPLAVLHVI
jgi:hypothetical protein